MGTVKIADFGLSRFTDGSDGTEAGGSAGSVSSSMFETSPPSSLPSRQSPHASLLSSGRTRLLQQDEHADNAAAGVAQGTPLYMAPELIRNEQARCDPSSDIFSWAITAAELLSGKPAYTGEN